MINDLINDYVKNKPEYQTGLTIDDLYSDYVPAECHHEICKMNENENMLGTSPMAVKAMSEAAALCNYYPEGSAAPLREKLAEKYGLEPLNYLVTEGASVALNLIGELFLQKGDEVIIPSVTYGAYKNVTRRFGGSIVTVPVKEDMSFHLEAMLRAITEKTKLIFFCNPNNPTGMVFSEKELSAFIKRVPERVIVVVDEAYFQFNEKGNKAGMTGVIQEENCHTILVRTFSKVYGMAGARIGYAVSSKEIIRALRGVANYFCSSRMAIAGALAALDDKEFEKKSRELIISERNRLCEAFRSWGYYVCDSGANFLFVDFKIPPKKLCGALEKYNIFLRGDFDYTRISMGMPEQNDRLLAVLPKVLKELSC